LKHEKDFVVRTFLYEPKATVLGKKRIING
ncbi:unnamed protein product, partial [marine sediment metagenome]